MHIHENDKTKIEENLLKFLKDIHVQGGRVSYNYLDKSLDTITRIISKNKLITIISIDILIIIMGKVYKLYFSSIESIPDKTKLMVN